MTSGWRASRSALDGQAGQVHQFQRVGVELLVGRADGQQVEGGDGAVALQRVERELRRLHLRDHVRRGEIGAFGQDAGLAIQDIVEKGQREVGHAQIVNVGEGQADVDVRRVPRLVDGVDLPADVSAGPTHAVQDGFDAFPGYWLHSSHLFYLS